MHTPYTIHQSKRDLRRKKKKYIYTYRCALSALQRPPAEGNIPADKARHTRCPGFEQPGATPGPPYYERTLSACAMSRTDAQRAGRPGRATERTTAQRTGALLLPLAPLAAPAEIKTMATLRLRDRREKRRHIARAGSHYSTSNVTAPQHRRRHTHHQWDQAPWRWLCIARP